MKQSIKSFVFSILAMMVFIPNVFAKDNVFFTNMNGVEKTKEEYELMSEHFDKYLVQGMPQELFDEAVKDIDSIKTETLEKKYIETITVRLPNGEVITKENLITKEEYDNYTPIVPLEDCNVGIACWETNAKEFSFNVTGSDDLKTFSVKNIWRTMPIVRSYDVIAARYSASNSNIRRTSYSGMQVGKENTYYTSGNGNIKETSNGVGISMNLYDDVNDILNNFLFITFKLSGDVNLDFYATYQHATSNVTLAQSQDYTFGASGLGGVLDYASSTIRNRYDGMQGLYKKVVFMPGV